MEKIHLTNPLSKQNLIPIAIITVALITLVIDWWRYDSAIGVNASLSVIVTYLLSKQLNPNHRFGAFVSVGILLALFRFTGLTNIFGLLFLWVCLRQIRSQPLLTNSVINWVLLVIMTVAMTLLFGPVWVIPFFVSAILPKIPNRDPHAIMIHVWVVSISLVLLLPLGSHTSMWKFSPLLFSLIGVTLYWWGLLIHSKVLPLFSKKKHTKP